MTVPENQALLCRIPEKKLWSWRLRCYLLVKKLSCICQVGTPEWVEVRMRMHRWLTVTCKVFTIAYALLYIAGIECLQKKLKNWQWQHNARYCGVPSFQHAPAVTRRQMILYLQYSKAYSANILHFVLTRSSFKAWWHLGLSLILLVVTNPMHTAASSLSSDWKLHSCLTLILNLERQLITRNFIWDDCRERASAGTPSLCKLSNFLASWLYFVPLAQGKPSPQVIPKHQGTYCCVPQVSNTAHKLVRFLI